ncbi:MAG: DUF4363 family protein [Peptococcaceae bacterium]|nr:DUF4363 family protein [Peptococcaceae bacterium]
MKRYRVPIFILLLTVFLIGFCIYTHLALTKAADSILADVEEIGGYLDEGRWTEGLTLCTALDQRWQKEQRIWAMLVDHQELDKVSESILTLRNRILSQDIAEASIELDAIRHHIGHIPEKEKLTLANLF